MEIIELQLEPTPRVPGAVAAGHTGAARGLCSHITYLHIYISTVHCHDNCDGWQSPHSRPINWKIQ